MPVVIKPSTHGANALNSSQLGSVANAKDLLWNALPSDIPPDIDLYQSTWGHGSAKLDRPVVPSTNGFVRSLIKAYGQHHHLTLRPDDVWFAILTQFSLYVNAHSEELRGKFVAHAGRQELRVEYSPFSRHDFDFAVFARDMARLLGTVVVDDELRRWATPAFSTTTANDEVVASVIMMGTLQKYFDFTCGIICGFPSVTLLGEKSDYDALLQKVDKLDEYGEEPRHFAALLRPVLRRFVRSFEDPTADDVLHFWRTAFDVDDMLCGVSWYTGWITAFCYWNEDGHSMYSDRKGPSGDMSMREDAAEIRNLVLDGQRYHGINEENMPPAWSCVPINIEQDGGYVKAEMFAGIMGIGLSASGTTAQCAESKTCAQGDEDGLTNHMSGESGALDTMSPAAAWWITEAMGPKCEAQKKRREEELAKMVW